MPLPRLLRPNRFYRWADLKKEAVLKKEADLKKEDFFFFCFFFFYISLCTGVNTFAFITLMQKYFFQ